MDADEAIVELKKVQGRRLAAEPIAALEHMVADRRADEGDQGTVSPT
jgi:hypothetical protein